MVVVLLTFPMLLMVQMVGRYTTIMEDEQLSLDVHAFGLLLLELITGQNALRSDIDQELDDQVSLHRKCNIDLHVFENLGNVVQWF